eukprot:620668-Amorphochlora_amoeboformis.AAC.1
MAHDNTLIRPTRHQQQANTKPRSRNHKQNMTKGSQINMTEAQSPTHEWTQKSNKDKSTSEAHASNRDPKRHLSRLKRAILGR